MVRKPPGEVIGLPGSVAAVALLLAPGVVIAQKASYTLFGDGCAPTGFAAPAPQLSVQGLPQVGRSFTVVYTGINSRTPTAVAQPVLLTGVSNYSWAGLRLPVRIPDVFPLFGCTLRVSPDLSVAMPWVGARFQDTVTIRVPGDVSLVGSSFYQQWFTFGVSCNPARCTWPLWSSRGGHGVIGS